MRISVLIGFVESWKGTVNSQTISTSKLPERKVVETLSAMEALAKVYGHWSK